MIKIIYFLFYVLIASTLHADWEPKIDFDSLIPSYIISTATLDKKNFLDTDSRYIGDPNGMAGFIVKSPKENCSFEAEVYSRNFIEKSTIKGFLPKKGETYRIYPVLEYDYDALYSVIEARPETLTFSLSLDDRAPDIKKVTTQVRSINDCLLAATSPDGRLQPILWPFAAYVNEKHPLVDKILQEALKLRLVDQFSGYQKNNPQHVYQQVYAIWNVLQRHGIKYSDITTPSVSSQKVWCQHVRFIGESLENTQANCVDGSVLFASICRAIGLKSFIALTQNPGHCYMGVLVDGPSRHNLVLETTMIGSVDLHEIQPTTFENQNLHSWRSFQAACEQGQRQFREHQKHFISSTPGYMFIDIGAWRLKGIQPLNSKKK